MTAAGQRDGFISWELTPDRTEGAVSRDAMRPFETETLSLKLLVRKICHLQPDKNVAKQPGHREREKYLRSYL